MLKLKHLFESIWFNHRIFSKKAYTNGLIIFVGTIAIAVVMLGVNGFARAKNIDNTITYEVEEEPSESVVVESSIVLETEDVSSSYIAAWVLSNYEQQVKEAAEVVKMAKEEEQERILRTSNHNLEEAEVSLVGLKDYTALVRIVEAEATDEDLKGKILVANVVMNRVASENFPDTIYDVVTQKIDGRAQFSPIDDGRYYSVKIRDLTIEAVEQAVQGTDYSEGALFFVAKSMASESAVSWFDRKLTFVLKHGVHYFYKY